MASAQVAWLYSRIDFNHLVSGLRAEAVRKRLCGLLAIGQVLAMDDIHVGVAAGSDVEDLRQIRPKC